PTRRWDAARLQNTPPAASRRALPKLQKPRLRCAPPDSRPRAAAASVHPGSGPPSFRLHDIHLRSNEHACCLSEFRFYTSGLAPPDSHQYRRSRLVRLARLAKQFPRGAKPRAGPEAKLLSGWHDATRTGDDGGHGPGAARRLSALSSLVAEVAWLGGAGPARHRRVAPVSPCAAHHHLLHPHCLDSLHPDYRCGGAGGRRTLASPRRTWQIRAGCAAFDTAMDDFRGLQPAPGKLDLRGRAYGLGGRSNRVCVVVRDHHTRNL